MEITDKTCLRVIFRSVEIVLGNVKKRENETPEGKSGHALAWLVRC